MVDDTSIDVRFETQCLTVEVPKGLVEEFVEKFCKKFEIKPLVDGAGKPKSVYRITPGNKVFHVTVGIHNSQVDGFYAFVGSFAAEKGINTKQKK